MSSGKCQAGDTVYARGTVLEAHSDAFQVRFEGPGYTVTFWVPSSECRLFEDIADIAPPRQASAYHIER